MKRGVSDLVWTCVIGVAAALVVSLPSQTAPVPVPVRVAFAVPLFLVLPGYALTVALFPKFGEQTIGGSTRVLLTVGLSVSNAILVGLALDLTPWGLRSWSWAAGLVCVTALAGGVGVQRRRRIRGSRAPGYSIWLSPAGAGGLLLAAVLLSTAVVVARTPLSAKNVQGYTALWILPAAGSSSTHVQLGISSSELHAASYRLVVQVGSRVVFRRPAIRLEPGAEWHTTLRMDTAPTHGEVRAFLYRSDRAGTIYRSVTLEATRQAHA